MSQHDPLREKLRPYQRALYDGVKSGEIDLANLVIPKNTGKPPLMVGIDLATGADRSGIALRMGTRLMLSAGGDRPAVINPEWINGLNAGRKAERTLLALAFETIALAHGATITRREQGRNPGRHSGSIDLTIALNGVGALVAFSNLHGGDRGLISWYNDYGSGSRRTRNFSGAFCGAVREYGARPHHKATTGGNDYHALATALDAGLCLAARGEAFQP